jgi:hypothetical protein
MSVAGEQHPATGIRIVLERTESGAPGGPDEPLRYTGQAFTPDAAHAIRATIEPSGTVHVTFDGPASQAEKIRLLVRAACRKDPDGGDARPPRRIVRWRESW